MNRDHKNLLAFIFGILLSVVAGLAFASTAPTALMLPNLNQIKNLGYIFGSADAACQAAKNERNSSKQWRAVSVAPTSSSSYNSLYRYAGNSARWSCEELQYADFWTAENLYPVIVQYCDISSTMGGTFPASTCNVCPTGTHEVNGVCVPLTECDTTAGTVVSSGMYDLGADESATPPVSACDGTCELSYNGSGVVARQLVGGAYHYFSQGSYTRTASTCTVSDVPSSSANLPPATCDSATQDQGTVNGNFVCLDRTTTKTTTESPPVTNPDGSVTKTKTTSDSATKTDTITTETTAADGTITTSTTTQPTPGTSTDFCVENPSDPTCSKDDIPWGDIPEAGIIPTHEVPVSAVYNVIGGEGQCPVDASISFMGQAITWSYSPICTFAQAIRPLVIGLAWLSFGFIIVGGLSRGK